MKQRGRKSADSKIVGLPRNRGSRRAPPAYLDEAEAAIWQKYQTQMPPDYFKSSEDAQLAELCRTEVELREIDEQLRDAKRKDLLGGYDPKAYRVLLRERREHLRIFHIQLRSLRLTKQSLDKKVVARAVLNDPTSQGDPGVMMPWDDDGSQ